MGCDIHSLIEAKKNDKWEHMDDNIFPLTYPWNGITHTFQPFTLRNYGVFGFLGNVRNYSHVPPLTQSRGLPDDISTAAQEFFNAADYHSSSFVNLSDLIDFNYDKTFEDRRCMKDGNGKADTGLGKGTIVTYRKFLGSNFFQDLKLMEGLMLEPCNVRILFAFDN